MPRATSRRRAFLALTSSAVFALSTTACGGCAGDDNNVVSDDDMGMSEIDLGAPDMAFGDDVGTDMGPIDMGPPPTDPIGQLNITWFQSDALYDFPEVYAQTVFSPELATSGILNPVGWLAATREWDVYIPDDYWLVPEERTPQTDAFPTLDAFTMLDAGAFVGTGVDFNASRDPDLLASDGAHVYGSLLEEAATYAVEEDLTGALGLVIDGGGDIAAAELADAFAMTEPIELTSHDPLVDLPVRYGEDIVVEWTPSATADDFMIVGLETFDGANYWRIADEDGLVNVNELAATVNARITDEPTVVLSRVLEQDVQLGEGVLQVVAQHKQWLYGRRVGPYEITPTVWPVGETTPVAVTWWDGEFTSTALDAGPGVTVTNATIDDTQARVMTFDVTVDPSATTGRADLTFGSDVTFPEAVWIAEQLPNAGDCDSAVDEGAAANGAYFGTDEGLDYDWYFGTDFCPLMNPGGREQSIPVSLQRGQRLEATLVRDDLNGVLYLASDCDTSDDVFDCTAAPKRGRAATLEYTAFTDEDLLLVVDGYSSPDAPAASYVVDLRTTGPHAFDISPRQVTDGVTVELAVQSFVGDFDGGSNFDFGPDITVNGAQLFGDFALVDITAGNGTGFADPTIDATLTIGGSDYTIADALYVRPYIGANATCAAADTAGALQTGSYEGLTLLGGFDEVTPVPCLSSTADGMEAIIRVDLGPSETLRARVDMLDKDPVLYVLDTCGGEVLACVDDRSAGAGEYIEWTGSAEPSTVYLVVDGYGVDDSDVFYLDLEITL